MTLGKARRERKQLNARLKHLAAVIAQKVEERRAKNAEARELRQKRRDKQGKLDDAQTDARIQELERDVARLHREIMELGDEAEAVEDRTRQLRKTRHALAKRLKKVQKYIKKALRTHGPDAAVKAGNRDIGVHEDPPGSNWGGKVRRYILWLGYGGPVYWCGCAAGWWTLKKAGGEYVSKIRRGYAGYVEADARAGVNGLQLVGQPVKGGIASLWNNEHIIMTTGKVSGGMFETIEGNTSAADGSQSNGGEVARKWRNISDADCFARQVY